MSELLRITSTNPRCWLLMPQVLERLTAFAAKFGAGDPAPHFQVSFVAPSVGQGAPMSVGVHVDGYRVVGHVLAELANDHGKPYAIICQFESDDGTVWPRGRAAEVWREVIAWAESFGCTELRTVAPTARHVRVYERLYGFRSLGWTSLTKDIGRHG